MAKISESQLVRTKHVLDMEVGDLVFVLGDFSVIPGS
jgi:hypothetical protein